MSKYVAILCGGVGTRLWPLSTEKSPKQFIKFFDGQSLFQHSIQRARKLVDTPLLILCNSSFHEIAKQQLLEIHENNVFWILEPKGRNTAPAILAAVLKLSEWDKNADLCILASDHYICDETLFVEDLNFAFESTEKKYSIVFGIRPTGPNTEYGYIRVGEVINKNLSEVDQFVEKPSIENAHAYVKAGNYFWNSGMFVLPVQKTIEDYKSLKPDLYNCVQEAIQNAKTFNNVIQIDEEIFSSAESISIDYAIFEKAQNVRVVITHFLWSDLGSYHSIYNSIEKDSDGNFLSGRINSYDTKNSFLVNSSAKQIVSIGLADTFVVVNDSEVFISSKNAINKLREIMHSIPMCRDFVENTKITERPWGFFNQISTEENGYKVKYISVDPNQILSLQRHKYRNEHWVIVEGQGIVTVGSSSKPCKKGDYIFIPKNELHRIENNSEEKLIFIEVQLGDCLNEDDIERIEDAYGRISSKN